MSNVTQLGEHIVMEGEDVQRELAAIEDIIAACKWWTFECTVCGFDKTVRVECLPDDDVCLDCKRDLDQREHIEQLKRENW